MELCGITLLERLLRNLQRLGLQEACVLSSGAGEVEKLLARPSWARRDIDLSVSAQPEKALRVRDILELNKLFRGDALLVASAGNYYDPRLLNALLDQRRSALLADSNPMPALLPLLHCSPHSSLGWMAEAALVKRQFLTDGNPDAALFPLLGRSAEAGSVAIVDAQQQETYVVSMRRSLRPVWFPAPDPAHRARAKRLLLDAAQNGTLDLPAKVHAPLETWIIARLCRTNITPMQITLFTACVSALVAIQFATGRLVLGTGLALLVGVLDGLDGKQARVKVETTELGKREHVLDYVLELSWWTALAWHFAALRQVPNAFALLALLVGSDLLDQLARRVVKNHVGRNLDDVAPIDRFVRLIGGRRNIYIWMLAAGLLLGRAGEAFVALCNWGALTAAVHALRAVQISRHTAVARTEGATH